MSTTSTSRIQTGAATGQARRGWHPFQRRFGTAHLTGWLFVLPALAGFAIFVIYPVIRLFYLSLTRSGGFGGSTFVGFDNFRLMTHDPVFLEALRNTLIFTAATTILQTIVPLVLALLIYRGPRRSGIAYRTLIFLPAAISLTVAGLIWQLGLTPIFGAFNRLLSDIGLHDLTRPWLSDPSTVLPSIILVSLWQSCGLFLLLYYAGLGNIDLGVLESARIDGAGPIREAWRITVPMLRPVIELVVILNVINGFKMFDLPFVMTAGGPAHASETLSTYVNLLTFGNAGGSAPAFGYGAAVGVVVFVSAAVASFILWRFRKTGP
jgi:ABC-type sugar transport system permease subunit